MPQAQTASTRAVDSLSDSNPTTLEDNQTIVENADGSVWLNTTAMIGERERVTSRRCDSEGDLDHSAKGGKIWWRKLIEQQKARDEAAKPKAPAKKGGTK